MTSEGIGDKDLWKTKVRKQLYNVPGDRPSMLFNQSAAGTSSYSFAA